MKKDLGKSYGEPALASNTSKPPEKYYPSTSLETDAAMDVPKKLIGKDFEVKVKVRICRCENIVDDKGAKQRLELEFRSIDFGDTIKDQDLQDDIKDAIEGIQESKSDEDKED